ncbi:MAG TPA: PEP-CTERM sorting domain-containing protein [Candidatus Dormibacteraeota bacterium]|nr:PEP-CTERM sorting domain-containing protein [Candidatus Dormibacteraeota bacterium]
MLSAVCPSQGQITLHDADSTALIDPTTQAGMFHWDIQGFNQLQQQWFWFGIGTNAVHSIDSISAPSVTPKGPNEVLISYSNPGFSVSIDYLLTGGNPAPAGQHANADIGESIKIVNNTANPLPFHFYQYSYFNLLGQSSDTVQLGQNLHGLYNEAAQNNDSVALTETVVTPGANHGEVAPVGGTLSKLNSGGPVTLGPGFSDGPIGPGAVTWALQWDFNINPGGSATISKDKYLDIVIIPEPSSLALVGLGIAGLAFRKRLKRA